MKGSPRAIVISFLLFSFHFIGLKMGKILAAVKAEIERNADKIKEIRSEALNYINRSQNILRIYVVENSKLPKHQIAEKQGWLILSQAVFEPANAQSWSYFFSLEKPEVFRFSEQILKDAQHQGLLSEMAQFCSTFILNQGSILLESRDLVIATVFANALESLPEHVLLSTGDGLEIKNLQGPPRSSALRGVLTINLEHRRDRKESFLAKLQSTGLRWAETGLLEFIVGVDGRTLDIRSPTVFEIFSLEDGRWEYGQAKNPHQDHFYSRGVLGCALSHILTWERIASDESASLEDFYLIFEDDIEFPSDFKERWDVTLDSLVQDRAWNMFWLGIIDQDRDFYGDFDMYENIQQFSSEGRFWSAGAFAYVMKKKAAIRMLEIKRQRGIQQPIDWFLFDSFGNFPVYKANPALVHHEQKEDSNTFEKYPQVRLLMPYKIIDISFSIIRPGNGSTVKGPEVLFSFVADVEGPAPLFVEAHKHSVICLHIGEGKEASDFYLHSCPNLFERTIALKGLSFGWKTLKAVLIDLSGGKLAESTSFFFVSNSDDANYTENIPMNELYQCSDKKCPETLSSKVPKQQQTTPQKIDLDEVSL